MNDSPFAPSPLEVPPEITDAVGSNYRQVRRAVDAAAEKAGRDPGEITIVAVSKTFGLDHVQAAAAAGLTHLAENRVQEAQQKIPDAPDALIWHMVGHVQRNKARLVPGLFDTVQSVDSLRLAKAIDRYSEKGYPVLLQVNLTGNPDQHGLAPDDLVATAKATHAETSLKLDGLMTIAPFVDDDAVIRQSFKLLRSLLLDVREAAPDHPWSHLSMGMTNDFEIAVEEGATLVRIGRAIFGDRR